MDELLQFVITGITVGMVYALIALGFVLIWKSSGVANLALGQLVLISSWFTYGMLVQAGLPLWIGFPVVILFALALGWMIERFALRPLIAQPILSLITVTLGIAFFIEGAVSFIWPKSVAALPRFFPQETIHIGTAVVSQEYLWAAAISLALFGLLSLFFKYHKGLNSFLGAIIAGPIIGLAENLGGGYLTPLTWSGIKEIIPFIIIIIVMFLKPYGLFGEVRIERI